MIGAGASAVAASVTGPLAALGTGDASLIGTFLGPVGAVALMWYFLQGEREERKRLTARAEASADAMARFATESVAALQLNATAQLALTRVLEELRDVVDANGTGDDE
jgi:hypothetical protein